MNDSLPETSSQNPINAALSNGPLLICVTLILCTWMISSAVESYGINIERAAGLKKPTSIHIPSSLTIRLESGNSPIRIQNN